MNRGGRSAAAIGVLLLIVAGCVPGRGPEPRRPSATLEPAVIGVVDQVGPERTLRLEGSDQVTYGMSTPVVWSWGNLEAGDLWLADRLDDPTWYAWLAPNQTLWSGMTTLDPDCWEIRGGAYDDGAFVHFSHGLHLRKAVGFTVRESYVEDPWPARFSDIFCVNRQGEVKNLMSIALPY